MAVAMLTLCDLCGLPAHAPLGADIAGRSHVFCCAGCRQVYQILLESDQIGEGQDPTQTTLYRQCLEMGLIARPNDPSEDGVGAGSPRPPIPSASPSDLNGLDATREAAFQIGGMWCSACAWLIEHALDGVRGVERSRVYFASDVVKVTYKPARVSPETFVATIKSLGYTAEPYAGEGGRADSPQARARRALFVRAVVALIFAVNAGMFQLPFYADFFQKQGLSVQAIHWLPRIELGLSLPVLAAGWPIFERAWAAGRRGAAIMETLIALGVSVAFAYSVWVVARGGVHVYFDTADMLIALVLVGKHVEAGARHDATGAIALLYGLLPKKALVKTPDGREVLVALAKLGVGDRVLVRPGERIPCDGVVAEGAGLVDESLLSGEARPVAKKPGDPVTGGTIAADAPLTVEVSRVGQDTTLAQMIGLVETALAAKSPVERWADAISRRFVPAIIALSVLTGVTLLLLGRTPDDALIRAVTVLVIACPCALGLATPLAVTSGVGAAASRGILIGNADVLQVLPRVRHLLLDKTGTLTEGRFAVQSFTGGPSDLAAVAALEDPSEHPLARALVAYAHSQAASPLPHVTDFTRHEGQGVTGTINGQAWFIGNRAHCAAQNAPIPAALDADAQAGEADAFTALFYGSDCHVRGLATLGDALRPGAAAAIRALTAAGLSLEVVSGDSRATVEAVTRRVGLTNFTAGMLPEGKAARVRELQDGASPPAPNNGGAGEDMADASPSSFPAPPPGPAPPLLGAGGDARRASKNVVAMAGDGINDAPALAQADAGLAFGSGTEIARRAADITLMGDDLGRLADLFVLARRTAGVIRQNLFWACLYNAVCLPLAVLGVIKNPIFAAGAMLVSSLSVVLNTKRLRRLLARTG